MSDVQSGTQYVEGRDWKSYRKANSLFPEVRRNEVGRMLSLVSPQPGELIVEAGTGNGVLTFPMAEVVGSNGCVITYDATAENVLAVQEQNNTLSLNINAKVQNLDYSVDEDNNSVDTVVSLAAFHHYDSNGGNDSDDTGFSGRIRAMHEFARVLKPGGRLVVGDVCANTCSSRYFDSIDTSVFCPGGHPHSFLNSTLADIVCRSAEMKIESFRIHKVPWTFQSEVEVGSFIKMIHGSTCSKEESLEHAKKKLNLWQKGGVWFLEWELFYLVAIKK